MPIPDNKSKKASNSQHFKSKKKIYLQILILLLVVGCIVLIFLYPEKIKELKKYGYLGSFLIAMIANMTIVIPAPGWAVIVALAGILDPWLLGLVSGLGATIGQCTAYLLGYSSMALIKEGPKYQKATDLMQRWGSLCIFFFALIPNPLVDIVGMAAGILKFPFLRFFFFCALGTIPKYLFLTLVGGWGLEFLLAP